MSSTIPFGPQLIGQTEKTLNALLTREIASVQLTEPQWVTLSLAVMGGGGETSRDAFIERLTDAVKITPQEAQNRVSSLLDAGLMETRDGQLLAVTDAGNEVFRRIRGRTAEITERLWGDLPDEDLQVAGRVLATVLDRARAEF
jgi:DNA-binding MarR family transcriptional regulator